MIKNHHDKGLSVEFGILITIPPQDFEVSIKTDVRVLSTMKSICKSSTLKTLLINVTFRFIWDV